MLPGDANAARMWPTGQQGYGCRHKVWAVVLSQSLASGLGAGGVGMLAVG